jgi:hypothetical protein
MRCRPPAAQCPLQAGRVGEGRPVEGRALATHSMTSHSGAEAVWSPGALVPLQPPEAPSSTCNGALAGPQRRCDIATSAAITSGIRPPASMVECVCVVVTADQGTVLFLLLPREHAGLAHGLAASSCASCCCCCCCCFVAASIALESMKDY